MAVMARASGKKRKASTPPSSKIAPEVVTVGPPPSVYRPAVDVRAEMPRLYANHVELNTTPYDMILTLGLVTNRFTPEEHAQIQRNETGPAVPVAQIILPLGLAPFLQQLFAMLRSADEASRGGGIVVEGDIRNDI